MAMPWPSLSEISTGPSATFDSVRVEPTATSRFASGHFTPGWTGPVYTCPMHPQVRATEPGACPICGMSLQQESGTAVADGPNPELVDFTRRFWIGTALTLPLLVLTMGPILGFTWARDLFPEHVAMWAEFALGTPVVFWCGWPFLVRGWISFRTRNLNMFTLILDVLSHSLP